MERIPSYVPHRPTPYVRSPASVRESIYDTNTEPYYQVTYSRQQQMEEDGHVAVNDVEVEDDDISTLAV